MVRLFLSEPNWKEDRGGGDSGVSKQWILLLNQLESVIWSLMTSGGRAEARLWLCNTIAGITSITSRQQRDLFVNLLRTRLPNQGLASQLLQMIFEKRPQKAGPVIAERSYVLEKFFEGNEFAESLRDGDILSIDTKYFVEFFVGLMYKEDSNVWDVISEFLMEESFSSLCNRLLISLEERELLAALELLHRYYSLNMEPVDFGNSSCWLDFVLSKFNDCESLDQLLLLNAVTNQGRQLLRLVNDEESQEEQTKIKDIVSQICTISSTANSLGPFLKECFKMKTMEATKFLGLQSWVIHYALSEENWISESWESLFSNNGISFRKSDKYAMLHHDGLSEENDSELDDGASVKRKHRKKKKSRKKRRRNFDDDDFYDNELLDLHASNSQLELQTKSGSWLLSTDGFSASWTNVDLPEHLSKFCFSVWMKWVFAK
ncbi:hypothetical protein GH714_024213 [Hevea brasiliensis]|uniref:Uncharacterized protein n=1 Tax=Hevea brasiliensis TaxID=3981 RepID=A0A6A6KNL0_HEVBR|nr:hypothetical protein GH714_024213 [Hevea brasiliensis]